MSRQLFIVPEHEFEPALGLPEPLPRGEVLLWQGAPDWKQLAISAFHVRKLIIYFGVILALRVAFGVADGAPTTDLWISIAILAPLAGIAIGMMALMAWFTARTALYTITDQRIVMRIGIVLSVTYNIPFRTLDGVALKQRDQGTGDLSLTIGTSDRIAFLHLWPHVRPWKITRAEPMLRAIPNVNQVGDLLARAIVAASGGIAKQAETVTSNPSRNEQSRGLATAS
jgi:hypothetical protein